MPTTSDFERMLREVALRVTRPRVAVLSVVHDHPHANTDSIIGVVREDLGRVSHQAVYDVLRALTAAGLVRRIQPRGSVARYESRVGDNHHHVMCRSCGSELLPRPASDRRHASARHQKATSYKKEQRIEESRHV